MFGDFVGQTGTTVGNGADLTLGDAVGSNVTFRTRFATGEVVFYLDTTRNAQKREMGWGVLTHGTPDKIERNVLYSTQLDARINWASDDVHYVYSMPVGAVLAYMLRGGLGDELPDWAPDGSTRLSYEDDDVDTLWKHRLKTADGEKEIGRYHADEGIYVPTQRRRFTAVGAASKTVAAADADGFFTFDNSAADRTLTLPAHGTAGIGHGFTVGARGLTRGGQYAIVVTPAAGDGIEGGADATAVRIPGGIAFDMVWDQPSDTWRVRYLNTAPAVWTGRRQTVAAGPVDTDGLPSGLPSTNGTLAITWTVAASSRFVAVAANGWDYQGRPNDRVGVSLANLAWSGLTASRAAATPNFLYVVVNADGSLTPGSTIQPPVYQWGGTPGTTAGQFTFNIAEMKGYLGNGTTAPEAFVVFVGEAATDGSGVISTVMYAYNGRYESAWTATLWATSTSVSRNHNLGVVPKAKDFVLECTTNDNGFLVGEQISMIGQTLTSQSSGVYHPHPLAATRNAMHSRSAADAAFIASNATTGLNVALTAASWKYKAVADRGWG